MGNIQSVIVSRSGFQSGAVEYAKHYDIKLLKLSDLPTLNLLLAKRIQSVALPTQNDVGEPFWVLMETRNGEITGTFYAAPQKTADNKKAVPLFFSRKDAEHMHSYLIDKEHFLVRGVPQHMLKFTAGVGHRHIMFMLMYWPPENGQGAGELISPEDVISRFYHGKRTSQETH